MPAASMSEEVDIQWGTTQVSASKTKIFYSSFFSEGIEYKLYDNVEVYSAENEEPYIGKIIKLWEDSQSGMKKALIRWFLRLRDLDREKVGDPKELYLAFGKGKGVTNENDLEVICGKCKVLCRSKDVRNKQPSASDLKNADFFFSKIYNVDLQHLSPVQRVVDKLGCEAVYNKEEWVTELSESKEEQVKQPKSLPVSKWETLSNKQEAGDASDLKPMQKDVGRDMEQKVSQGSVSKRQQAPNDEEIAKNKKFKTSASTSLQATTAGAVLRESCKEEKVTPCNQDTVSKSSKVSIGQEVQRKTNLPACSPSKMEAKSLNLEKSFQGAGGPIKVSDGQEVQSKLISPDFQIKSKSVNVEKALSSKKTLVSEITSREVDDAVAGAVTNLKISKQVAEIKSLSKADQSAMEALSNGEDALGQTVVGSRNSRQLAEADSLPKIDTSAYSLASLDAPKSTENSSEVQRDPFKLVDNFSGLVEAAKSIVKKSISTLKVKKEAEVNAGSAEDQEKVSLSRFPEPECFLNDTGTGEESLNVTKKPKIGTGPDIEKKSLEPVKEKRRIFKELPWEGNLQQGLSFGKVLLLQNLDPSLTSGDVRDMLKNILQGVSDVRIIPQETACPYGQALAVFDSRMLANSALQEMERKCLVFASSKRPVIATKFKEPSNLTRFPGHLALDKLRLSRNLGADDYKKAVSTSHSSQPNTIEYEMAMEWRRLQEISQTCQVELFEKQREEIEEIRKSSNRKGF